MKQHPILFSTPMVQAILEGHKTQTRRIIKPQPLIDCIDQIGTSDGIPAINDYGSQKVIKSHYGKPGDVLWVRETWAPAINEICYKADYTDEVLKEKRNIWIWKPSIHMPKKAARLWLEITGVNVEKLKGITKDNAKAEGVKHAVDFGEKPIKDYYYFYPCNDIRDDTYIDNPITSFYSLWKSINGQESWDANPWVWVISFKRIQKPSNF